MLAKKFDDKVNSYIKVDVGKQLVIFKTNTYGTSILNLFSSIVSSKKMNLNKKNFWKFWHC